MMKKLLIIIGFLFLPSIAAAQDAEYVVRQESVGQCLVDAAEEVVRTFRVFCKDNKSIGFVKTEKVVSLNVDCDDSEQVSKDNAEWLQEAGEEMNDGLPLISSEQCDLEGWPLGSKENAGIMAGAVAFAVVAAAFFKADDGSEYKLDEKVSKSACLSRGNKRLGKAKYCHNCKKGQKGEKIKREYDVFCKNKLAGQVTVVLKCKPQYLSGDHWKEDEALMELAEEKWREKVASMSSNECVAP